MKLGNFLSIDPSYQGTGLKQTSRLDRQIWDEYASNPDNLKDVARAIRDVNNWMVDQKIDFETEILKLYDDSEFPEGKILTRLHKVKERSRQAVASKKKKVLQETGTLECEVCGFDFFKFYGPLGKGFAECHHTIPISELTDGYITKLSDLAIVCANCHRMLHKARPLLSINNLQEIIEDRRL